MREYAKVCPTFWNGDTGRRLRGHPEAQIVALYLVTGSLSNMIGLYSIPLAMIAAETGLSIEGARKGLRRGFEGGFCFYDEDSEQVFIPKMAEYQIGRTLKAGDNRIRGLEKLLESFRKSPFFNDFLSLYKTRYHLNLEPNPPSQSPSPFEAPRKPLPSQEQNQEQDSKNPPGTTYPCPPKAASRIFDHWLSHDALVQHRTLTASMRKHINARLLEGRSEADLCQAISRYAELCQQKRAPGYNGWSLEELMKRQAGAWIDRLLDPRYRGIARGAKGGGAVQEHNRGLLEEMQRQSGEAGPQTAAGSWRKLAPGESTGT